MGINPLPEGKILVFIRNQSTCRSQYPCGLTVEFPFDRIEHNGENVGYQHFLLFPQCFEMSFCWRASTSLCVVQG